MGLELVSKEEIDVKHLTAIIVGEGGGVNLSGIMIKKGGIEIPVQTDGEGLFSTRTAASGNPFGATTTNPTGDWEILLAPSIYGGNNGERKIDEIKDIIMVLTVEGQIIWD